MRRPRPPKVGDYLVVDDESGFVTVRSNIAERWDGALVRKSQNEERNPQEFVRAGRDPAPLRDIRPPAPQEAYCPAPFRIVGTTIINYLIGAGGAALLNEFDFAIATAAASASVAPKAAEVGCTFYVFPTGGLP